MDTLLQDLRHALRSLRRNPAFSAVTVLTLALGLGATTAIASLLYGILLRPLAVADPQHLVAVQWYFERGEPIDALTETEFAYWRDHAKSFAGTATYASFGGGVNLETADGAQHVRGQFIGDGLWSLTGVRPYLGREFTPDETRPDAPTVAMLSYGLWRDRFNKDRGVVGGVVRVNGTSYTVVGVMPAGFEFGAEPADLWLPLTLRPDPRDQGHNTSVLARLAPGVTLAAAQQEMARLLVEFRRDVPGHAGERERGVALVPYRGALVGGVRPTLLLLFGAVALVLLIAVANAAGLFFGRAAARHQELAVRAALGARGWALARPLLAESTMLGLAGGVAGVLLARWMLALVLAMIPRGLPSIGAVGLDWPVLAAALGLSLMTGVVVGILPALAVGRGDLRGSLQAGDRGLGGARQRVRALLVGTEVALSVILLAGAGLLLLSLSALWRVDPGFSPARVWAIEMSLPPEKYRTAEAATQFEEAVRQRLAALPGVTSVATASSPPFERGLNIWVNGVKDGRPLQTYIEMRLVSPGYFTTLGIPVMQGRPIAERDARGAAPVLVVSAALAHVYWPAGDAVGRTLGGDEVVGVVGDVRTFGFDRAAPPMVYRPAAQASDGATRMVDEAFLTTWLVKSARPLDVRGVQRVVAEVDPGQPVVSVRAMEDVMAASLGPRRFVALLLELFAGVAILLAAVGIYGVVSYGVGLRRREFGLRVALGATSPDVLGLVLKQGAGLALGGAAIGVAGALALTRFLRSLLYGVRPADPAVLLTAAALLVVIALVASFFPARRATRVDPMIALRAE